MESLEALKTIFINCKDLLVDKNGEVVKLEDLIKTIKQDLEILKILKEHLYVCSGLVELKITNQEYATMHKVKYHNGIPIVNQLAIDKINEWFYRRNK